MEFEKIRFVCNVNEHKPVREALDRLDQFNKQAEEKTKFLNQQIEALGERKKAAWRELWEACVWQGLIDPSMKFEDWNMSLVNEKTQLLIHPTCEHSGIGSLIAHIKKELE